MSFIPLKADIHQRGLHVRLVPLAVIFYNQSVGRKDRGAIKCAPTISDTIDGVNKDQCRGKIVLIIEIPPCMSSGICRTGGAPIPTGILSEGLHPAF